MATAPNLSKSAITTCSGTGEPLTEEYKIQVLDDPDIKLDWVRYPFEYNREKRNPWTLSRFAFRTPNLLLRFHSRYPLLPPATGTHLILHMLVIRHGILEQVQPSPEIFAMQKFSPMGRGLTVDQMMATALFPNTIFALLRYPRKTAPFPNETYAFRDHDPQQLKYYSTQGIPTEIVRKLWVDPQGKTIHPTPIDGDPDSDAEMDLLPSDFDQKAIERLAKEGAPPSVKGFDKAQMVKPSIKRPNHRNRLIPLQNHKREGKQPDSESSDTSDSSDSDREASRSSDSSDSDTRKGTGETRTDKQGRSGKMGTVGKNTVGSAKTVEAVKTDKNDKAVKTDKNDKAVKTDKNDKAAKTDKNDKAVKTDKNDKAVKTDKDVKNVKARVVRVHNSDSSDSEREQ